MRIYVLSREQNISGQHRTRSKQPRGQIGTVRVWGRHKILKLKVNCLKTGALSYSMAASIRGLLVFPDFGKTFWGLLSGGLAVECIKNMDL